MNLTLPDRIAGGLVGLLVGDALGVPHEFHLPSRIPSADLIEMDLPPGFPGPHAVPPGTYSDDGAQALCLLASLLDRGRVDTVDLGRRLVGWWRHGDFAVDRSVFDIGNQTASALGLIERGGAGHLRAPASESSNGNGSLMRSLPLALWHRGSDASLARDAAAQSAVTHPHPRSMACCSLYCLWARKVLAACGDPWAEAVEAAGSALRGWVAAEFRSVILPACDRPGHGSGYVVDCLASARRAVAAGPYQDAVRHAIGLGHDTDTTACVAGGIAGIRDGIDSIPARWVAALRGREQWWGDLLRRLVESRCAP